MYVNDYTTPLLVYPVASYAKRSTASGSIAEAVTTVTDSFSRRVNSMYIKVGVTTAFPNYSDRGPDLNLNVYLYTDGVKSSSNFSAPNGIATTKAFNFGATPSTAKSYIWDISGYGYGDVAIGHSLASGVGGATARATYSVQFIAKGW